METEVGKLKKNQGKSSTAVTTGGANVTQDEIDKWNAWVTKHDALEARFNKLMVEWENLDAPKVKTDIIQILCQQNNFIVKDNLVPINEHLRRHDEEHKEA